MSSAFVTVMLACSLARHRVAAWSSVKREQYSGIAKLNHASYQLVIFFALLVRGGFVLALNIRKVFRAVTGFMRGGEKLKDWKVLEVSDLSEVIPLVQGFGARTDGEIALPFSKEG